MNADVAESEENKVETIVSESIDDQNDVQLKKPVLRI